MLLKRTIPRRVSRYITSTFQKMHMDWECFMNKKFDKYSSVLDLEVQEELPRKITVKEAYIHMGKKEVRYLAHPWHNYYNKEPLKGSEISS